MATITFDTHKFISTLIEAGFEVKQAEAVSEAFKVAQTDTDVASKQDIESLRQDMKVSMSELKVDLIKWVTGALIAQAAVIATLVKLLRVS
jgi:hypothetical protein